MELAVLGETLNGRDFGTLGLDGKNGASFDGLAVEQHGACAAQRGFASDMSTGQVCDVAQVMDQQHPRLDLVGARLAVDSQVQTHRCLSVSPWNLRARVT